jgi:hyperosmotically inducible periplasmic protein
MVQKQLLHMNIAIFINNYVKLFTFISICSFSLVVFAVEDSITLKNVVGKIDDYKIPGSSDLSIQIKNGVVFISGNIETDKYAVQVIEAAMGVLEVKDINTDKLYVKPKSEAPLEAQTSISGNPQPSINGLEQMYQDTFITAKVKGFLIREAAHDTSKVKLLNIETKNGVVYLVASVTNESQETESIKNIKGMIGIKDVVLIIDHKK